MKLHFFLHVLLLLVCKNLQSQNSLILITSLYNETVQKRIDEYLYCLKRNLDHSLVDHIHVIYDTSKDKEEEPSTIFNFLKQQNKTKLTVSKTNKRPTYSDSFSIANDLYPDKQIIIANADIFFDSSLELLNNIALDNTFLCLTRWDITADGRLKILTDECNKKAFYSQDAWIFKTPILIPSETIVIGTLGCDNQIAYEMLKLGYDVYNPCLDIRCCHLHLSEIRNYDSLLSHKINSIYVPWCVSSDIKRQKE